MEMYTSEVKKTYKVLFCLLMIRRLDLKRSQLKIPAEMPEEPITDQTVHLQVGFVYFGVFPLLNLKPC